MVTVIAEGQAGEPPTQKVVAEAGGERWRHIAQNQTSQDYETFESIDAFWRHFDYGDCGRGLRRFARDTPRRGAESRRRATLLRIAGGGRQGIARSHPSRG